MSNDNITNMEARLGTKAERTCQHCHRTSFSVRHMKRLSTRKKGFVECEHCFKKYTNSTSLIRHLFSEHRIFPKCQSPCSKTFNSFELYTKHRRAEHRNYLLWGKWPDEDKIWEEQSLKNISCHICKKEISRTNISRHIRDVHEISDKNLDTAPETETLVYKFACPQCDKAYKRKDHLVNHTKSVHESPTEKIKCGDCGKLCKNKMNLSLHIQDVHNTNKYPCMTCGKLFSKKFNQLRHSESCKHDKSDESDISDE